MTFALLLLSLLLAGASLTQQTQSWNYRQVPGLIYGHCSVQGSIGSPLPSVCANLGLALKNAESGEEIERSSTDAQGRFQFKAKTGLKYLIVPAGEGFEVASPKTPFASGMVLNLELRAK